MSRLIWADQAIEDVRRLYLFLQKHNEDAARRAARTIKEKVAELAEFPESGRPVEEMAPQFREWPIPFGNTGYVALYRIDGNLIIVLSVKHQKEAGYLPSQST